VGVNPPVSDDLHSRRGFFKQVLKRYVEPAAEYLDARAHPDRLVVLRPPGALAEVKFLDVCERCHACIDACPADAIRPIGGDGPLANTPGVVVHEQPCVVCTDLDCMSACPTGALVVTDRFEIDMGTAVVDQSTCVRPKGDLCQLCVELCPLGSRAIRVNDADAIEVLDGCIGCGVCEQACPTSPKSVVVVPREQLDV